jgi:hypothetical protein
MIGLLALSLATPLCAQGITSAALQGRVLQTDSAPIADAIVTAILPASGTRWQVVTDAAGRFFVENVRVGGPYVIEARALGFKSAGQNGVFLALGQRYHADFVLETMAVQLPEVTVTAAAHESWNVGRSGPGRVVPAAELSALPNVNRDLNGAAALDPLAALRPLGGISIGGQNQSFNSLQVDGGVNADLYLGRTPGGASPSAALPEVLPHTISLETVSEFQVLAAPFDVRLGGFAGGLLNAVTKSGTNVLHGSLFTFLQDGVFSAKDATGRRSDFATWQFGGTLSGPIVQNRIHFFVNTDLQQRVVPDVGYLVAADTIGRADVTKTGISFASVARFQQILRDSFSLNPGSIGPSDGRLPAQDLFVKITVQLGATGQLELSQHHAHAERREFIDTGRTYGLYALSSVAGTSLSTAQTSRLNWSTLLGGRAQNELILSYERLRDSCHSNASFPLIQVSLGTRTLIAGPNSVCPTTSVRQHVLEMTENLTIGAGAHLVTVGSHAELFHFRDPLVQVSAGRWLFSNLDSLAAGRASHYDRGLGSADSTRPSGADFRVFGLGLYAQDRWALTTRLTLTAGLRFDVPFLLDATRTNAGARASSLRIDTGRLPSGNALWSPRLGVNYDLRGDGSAFVRGGIGLFSGPPPYRWLGNAYRETGDETVVFCNRPVVPSFDPDSQPATCAPTGGTSPRISFFDPDFRLPQNLKLALGVDTRLPGDIVATIDLLYTRAIHQLYITDANLGDPTGTASGEGGRALYGTISGTTASPAWRDTSFGAKEIYRVSNRGGDHSVSLSTQLHKRFGETLALYVSYAYSQARDRMSLVNFPARANFSNTPLDGSLENRRPTPSFFDTPHKIALTATLGLPHRIQLSLLYIGASQPPYTYVIDGDVNADGIGGPGSLPNDAVYVPRDSQDITLATSGDWAALNTFIESQQCLRQQRGRIMARNSCRNGWLGTLNARAATTLPLAAGRRFQIIADIFNLPNLISARWGRQMDVTTGPTVRLLQLRGWDTTTPNARGIYQFAPPQRGVVDAAASRWRLQLGVRYGF